MIIKPSVRGPLVLNAHPKGCEANVLEQIEYVKKQGKYEGPKNVLIIGGSAGYGLASKISLLFGANSNVLSLAFEQAPEGKRTGTAGYWNNLYCDHYAQKSDLISESLNLDCFVNASKEITKEKLKSMGMHQIDLIIYSVAAPRRNVESENTIYTSSLKPIGKAIQGKTINFGKNSLDDLVLESASEEEVKSTIKVMGGEDWELWINFLAEEKMLSEDFKTINLSYIGSSVTADIYKNGTIGAAKKDLTRAANQINADFGPGHAAVAVNKAIISRASAVIPYLGLYVGALFKVMKEENKHESIIQHQHRLISGMLYGNEAIIDAEGNYRPDSFELDSKIQNKVIDLMDQANEKNFTDVVDYSGIKQDFLQINGFSFKQVDYTEDIDLAEEIKLHKI